MLSGSINPQYNFFQNRSQSSHPSAALSTNFRLYSNSFVFFFKVFFLSFGFIKVFVAVHRLSLVVESEATL